MVRHSNDIWLNGDAGQKGAAFEGHEAISGASRSFRERSRYAAKDAIERAQLLPKRRHAAPTDPHGPTSLAEVKVMNDRDRE